jgi:hypothetical protein
MRLQLRVISVVMPLSSRKIKFSGARLRACSHQAARLPCRARPSEVTFFEPHAHFPQYVPQSRHAHFNLALLPQAHLQFSQGEIRLRLDPLGQLAGPRGRPGWRSTLPVRVLWAESFLAQPRLTENQSASSAKLPSLRS